MDDDRPAEREHIFISYRRDDARGPSGRLYDWLRIAFRHHRVFRDVHSFGIGKWRQKIKAALDRSCVCVVVIGPRWANDEMAMFTFERRGDAAHHRVNWHHGGRDRPRSRRER